jgi:hypothetical protein
MLDLTDVEPQQSGDLIPDGTYAKVILHLRRGGADGAEELDKGLLRASSTPGSNVLSLDAELTVVEGRHARRKFWQPFTVSGGMLDGLGQSIGWSITKRTLRGMIDSAHGLDPHDHSEAAATKNCLRGLADLDGLTFAARISVEPSRDPAYPDRNRLDHPVLPTEPEWHAVMNGKEVPPKPARGRTGGAASATQPLGGQSAPEEAATAAPAGPNPLPRPAAAAVTPATTVGKPLGPKWMNQ